MNIKPKIKKIEIYKEFRTPLDANDELLHAGLSIEEMTQFGKTWNFFVEVTAVARLEHPELSFLKQGVQICSPCLFAHPEFKEKEIQQEIEDEKELLFDILRALGISLDNLENIPQETISY